MAVIFSADDGIHGQELWITNGTAEGTRLLKDINPAGSGMTGWSLAAIGDTVVFTATDGTASGIWTTDGTVAGTVQIAPLNLTHDASRFWVQTGGALFASVGDLSSPELWISDGTSAGTQFLSEQLQRPFVTSTESIAAVGGKFVFANYDSIHGSELWITDGTAEGTQLLKDLMPGDPGPYGSEPRNFESFGDRVVFSTSLDELYMTDGTSEGTFEISGLGQYGNTYEELSGDLLFSQRPGSLRHFQLRLMDGASGDIQVIKSFVPDMASWTYEQWQQYNNWTVSLNDFTRFPNSDLVVFSVQEVDRDTYQFGANSGLWITDGTSAGTKMLGPAIGIGDLTDLGDRLIYLADGDLWVTDGTASGTLKISTVDIRGYRALSEHPGRLNDKLIFFGDDGETGVELWVTDGTSGGTHLIKDINPIGDSNPFGFVTTSGLVYFNANDGVNGYELWVTDGTEAGTRRVKEINPTGDSISMGFTVLNLAPDNVTLSATAVAENANAGTLAGNLIASDFDLSDTHTFTLLDSAGGRFVLDGAAVKTAEGAVFDFESETAFAITVRATDQGGKFVDKTLTINVTDVSDIAPTDVTLSATAVAENVANRTVIGTLVASDPESSDTHTFTLLDDAGGRFAVSGEKIVVADRLGIDFEQAASHTITVRATDQGGKFYDKTFTITLSDVTGENVVGDTRDNIISAGAGIDRLSGGAGADRMSGGNGSDVYYVERTADVVIESNANLATGGHDTVLSSASYALSANVERLMLGGKAEIDGYGNALNNLISGNEAANTIDGGLGSDYLTGGAGRDTFRFSSALNGNTNKDFITDFNVADDTLQLSVGTFRGLAVGDLKASAFYAAAGAIKAYDASDRIVYNTTTGDLYYDADGVGGTSAIKFATLRGRPALSAADFDVVGIV